MNNGYPPADGFRLDRLEVYNWGTFHDQIYVFPLGGQTALLTGANGSGKSTLVDALLTLLVARRSRIYNEASGSVTRRQERTEMTYVRGDYGRIRDEFSGARVQSLRDHQSYSVILAVFRNYRTEKTVTIAQLMWIQEGDRQVSKQHVIAPRDLSISEHFAFDGDTRRFRAHMRRLSAEVIDKFSTYSQRFRAMVGVRSEKALDLFRQIIGIKEIDNLTAFLREHMLEPLDVDAEIEALRQQYDDLITALNAIEQDEQQLQMLQPMLEDMDKHTRVVDRQHALERAQQALPAYFAARKAELLEDQLAHEHGRLQTLESELARCDERVSALNGQQLDLEVAIKSDNVGQQIAQLQKDLVAASDRQKTRKAMAVEYDRRATELGFMRYQGDPSGFHETRTIAEDRQRSVRDRQENLQIERDHARDESNAQQAIVHAVQAELEDLRQRRSQIPAEDLRVRARIADALKVDPERFPFIGELIRVRDDQRLWEGAVERLLRGFARQLLVPEEQYRRVTHYVNHNNLRGRLIYNRVEANANTRLRPISPNTVPATLEVRKESEFHAWLHNRVAEQFDYACTETLEVFQREMKAITPEGQIRHSAERHEKDDRYDIHDRTKYVLGWDNRSKIEALERRLRDYQAGLAAALAKLRSVEDEQNAVESEIRELQDFLSRFEDFTQIDWHEDQKRIEVLQEQISDLNASSEHLATLRQQLATIKRQLSETEKERRTLDQNVGSVKTRIAQLGLELESCRARISNSDAREDDFAYFESRFKGTEVSLMTIDDLQSRTATNLAKQISAAGVSATELSNAIVSAMTNFRNRFSQVGLELGQDIAACDEYRRLAQRIQHDDLPKHHRRFRNLLNRNVLNAFTAFRTRLHRHGDEIRESVAHLNEALRTIEYTPSTYVELQLEANRDQEIRQFKQELDDAVNVGDDSPEGLDERFMRVKTLIERFDAEQRWRVKVTDVRNWFVFAAEERYRADSSVKEYHSDTSGKSGGQKAKLAYTIMASAIAYQYGLDSDDRRSNAFRFVVVDEAFSKSDEANARYAMELFKTLGLQLLVVTPLDKIQVVDPYIETCGITVN
ncbi:MAG: SbcC/MukB-like Walker B domain-containing protein, partial [Phototrophicaceae bacterium]